MTLRADLLGHRERIVVAERELRLEWRPRATTDLEHLRERIARDQPAAAMRVAAAVLGSAELLRTYPRLGRVGRARNTREFAVALHRIC
jgi:toxin ParE1/3/4